MEERGWKVFAPEEEEPDKQSDVFFNDKMIENRDISEAAFKAASEIIGSDEIHTCDALAASGIRGFRFSQFSDYLVLNDVNPNAVESIEKGLNENGIEAEVTNKDANVVLTENRNRFHLIDVDPFGPFTTFLDSTARAANHDSFVGLTATDNAVPAGSYKKTCMRRYGVTPLKNSFMHETALRIYIHEAFRNFARYDKCFEPKLAFQHRHYCRVIGRVTESKSRTNKNLENTGFLSFCPECRWRVLEKEKRDECELCGHGVANAGPLWIGKFSDQRFTEKVLEEMPEEWESGREIVEYVDSEAEIITPFYDLHELCSSMGISSPKRDPVIENIHNRGYPISRTHFSPTGFRTDAPLEDIKDAITEVKKEN